ncbi:hypothetical protein GF312_13815 [Candidatus Poribacteria bacterium]|nr:hypothetical protein [Candidatus Poribacteria bacterium]
MMNFIRQKLKFLMWFVAIFFVAGLFFVGGRTIGFEWIVKSLPVSLLVSMPGCARSAGIIMRVGDYNVDLEEFQRVRENTIEIARFQYKDNFNTYAKNIDFDQEAIDSITKYALLLQEADKRRIYVSKWELDKAIREFPYIMPDEAASRVKLYPYYSMAKSQDGKLNQNTFKYLLSTYGKITPEEFSEEVENAVRISKLKEVISGSALVSDLEIKQEYKKQNEKATIKYIELKHSDFRKEVKASDAEIEEYFKENILDYKVEDKVNISFIKIDPKIFEDKIQIPDAEVKSYYEANKEEEYFEPEKVKARHILVRIDSSASTEDKTKARALAENILGEAKKPNADFPAIAEKFANEPFEVKHEDLGYFERGKMV